MRYTFNGHPKNVVLQLFHCFCASFPYAGEFGDSVLGERVAAEGTPSLVGARGEVDHQFALEGHALPERGPVHLGDHQLRGELRRAERLKEGLCESQRQPQRARAHHPGKDRVDARRAQELGAFQVERRGETVHVHQPENPTLVLQHVRHRHNRTHRGTQQNELAPTQDFAVDSLSKMKFGKDGSCK